jgi:hypothetical protein
MRGPVGVVALKKPLGKNSHIRTEQMSGSAPIQLEIVSIYMAKEEWPCDPVLQDQDAHGA